MPLVPGMEPGFCFEAMAADEKTMVVVNVCGHDSVGMALAKSMEEVSENYLDEYGVDNLVIPISVGSPKKYEGKNCDFTVDVVVHPTITRRCVNSHHLFEHFIKRLTNLSIEWILQECGMRLNLRTCKLIPGKNYFENNKENIDQLFSEFVKSFNKGINNESIKKEILEDNLLPIELQLDKSQREVEKKKSPLITEIPTNSGIRKGFLTNTRLYSNEGTSECNQPPPDPLLHFPESLRKKCQVIDTRNFENITETKKEIKTTMLKNDKEKILSTNIENKILQEWTIESLNCNEKEMVVSLIPPLHIKSMKDVDLTASQNSIEVGETFVKLPKSILVDDVSAKFLKSSRKVIITCPLA